jgi:hypothetical protein
MSGNSDELVKAKITGSPVYVIQWALAPRFGIRRPGKGQPRLHVRYTAATASKLVFAVFLATGVLLYVAYPSSDNMHCPRRIAFTLNHIHKYCGYHISAIV